MKKKMMIMVTLLTMLLSIFIIDKTDVYASEQLETGEVKVLCKWHIENTGNDIWVYETWTMPKELADALNASNIEYNYMMNGGVDYDTAINYVTNKYELEKLVNKYGWWFN